MPSAQSVNNIAENALWGDEGGLSRAGAGHLLPPTGWKEGRVGEYPVRGFNDPIELFAFHG